MELLTLKQEYARACGLRESFVRRAQDLEREIRVHEAEAALLDKVCGLLRTLIDQEVSEAVLAIERLQVEGLQSVFHDQDLDVQADVGVQRGKVSVSISLSQKLRSGTVIEGPANDAFGGSVSTVQSVVLRVTCIFRQGLRPILCLDESLPAFDDTYVYSMGDFLRGLCERLGLDVVAVTHVKALADSAHTVYRIENKDGSASFQPLRVVSHAD